MFDAVPDEWERTSLGDVVTLEYGRSLPASSRIPGDVPVYGSNGMVGCHSEPLVGERGIVIGRKGTAGSVHVTDGAFWPIDTTYFVRPRREMDFGWLAATLHHANLSTLNEATGVPGLNRDKAYRQPVLLPPLDEQRRIAEVLRSVDAVLSLSVGIEAHLWTLREIALSELFSARADEAGEPTVLGRLPAGWHVSPAENVCEAVIDCKNRTPPIAEIGFTVVRTMNVRHGRFVRHNLARTDAASFDEWTKRGRPKPGDILITREAPIGEVCAVPADEPVCLGQRMMLYRPRQTGLLSGFLLYALQSRGVREHLIRLGGGSTVGHVRVGDIRRLPLPLPDIDKQAEISEALADIDDAIDRASEATERLRGLKGTLASDLLSGRVRVPR